MAALLEQVLNGEVAGVAVAGALIVGLRLLVPEHGRKLLRQPIGFLIAHLVGVGALQIMPEGAPLRRAISVLSLLFLLASIGRSLVLLVLDVAVGRRLHRPPPKIIRDLTQGVVYGVVLLISLRAVGFDPGSLLTTSALLTAVIGLSLQETLGNLFAGLAIQLQRPFDVGDWIQFDTDDKRIGRVIEINWRATTVVTLDDVEVIVPNGVLAKSPIKNFTKPSPISRRSVYVQAPYDVPPRRVHQAILDAIDGAQGVLPEPPPNVVTNRFADDGVEYWVRFWTDQFHKRDGVDGGVRDRIWYAFKRAGIGIPYPTRTVHVRHDDEETRARAAETATKRREQVLHGVDFLGVLPTDELARVAHEARLRQYLGGEIIVRRGDRSTDFFIVERGEVAVCVPEAGEGSAEREVARLAEGKFFGEMALMTGEPRTATVRASSDCELLVIGSETFKKSLESSPDLVERISHVLAERQALLEEQASIRADGGGDGAVVAERGAQLLSRIRSFFRL
jgi:small-conductance mechanosensitive channel/CRP-like cAMP-binding protein